MWRPYLTMHRTPINSTLLALLGVGVVVVFGLLVSMVYTENHTDVGPIKQAPDLVRLNHSVLRTNSSMVAPGLTNGSVSLIVVMYPIAELQPLPYLFGWINVTNCSVGHTCGLRAAIVSPSDWSAALNNSSLSTIACFPNGTFGCEWSQKIVIGQYYFPDTVNASNDTRYFVVWTNATTGSVTFQANVTLNSVTCNNPYDCTFLSGTPPFVQSQDSGASPPIYDYPWLWLVLGVMAVVVSSFLVVRRRLYRNQEAFQDLVFKAPKSGLPPPTK